MKRYEPTNDMHGDAYMAVDPDGEWTTIRDTEADKAAAVADAVAGVEHDWTIHMATVIAGIGVAPGLHGSCRCEMCKAVALKMDESGCLDHLDDKWYRPIEPKPKGEPE